MVLIASLLMAASVGCYTYSVGSVCFECCRIECGEAERVARGRHGIISSIRHQKLTNFRQDEQQLCCCLIALSAVCVDLSEGCQHELRSSGTRCR